MAKVHIAKPGVSAGQFEKAMAKYAAAEKREAQINKMVQSDVNTLQQLYEAELHSLAHTKKKAFDIAQAYCRQNKEALFTQHRSIGTPYGVAGFKLETPLSKTQVGNNWQKVLPALTEKLPRYVCTTDEPAHNLFLSGRHKERVAPLLIEIGVRAVQEDLFYIEPIIAA
jgi:hypothetical protein